ncbi:MAG: hypothetical protein SCH66_13160 [Methanolobus sp.]|nr:hypothetical protein [Methanolobus sp.]
MKKTLLILLLLLAVLIQPASAITFSELDLVVNEYNENADQVPSLIKNMLGDEVVHLLIEMDDGSELHIKAVTENALITTFEEIGPEEGIGATLKVTVKENAIDQLPGSENPLEAFYNAMENKDIVIEPVGFVDTIKFQVASVLLKLSDLLGLV